MIPSVRPRCEACTEGTQIRISLPHAGFCYRSCIPLRRGPAGRAGQRRARRLRNMRRRTSALRSRVLGDAEDLSSGFS